MTGLGGGEKELDFLKKLPILIKVVQFLSKKVQFFLRVKRLPHHSCHFLSCAIAMSLAGQRASRLLRE